MSAFINNMQILGRTFIISPFADDTVLFLFLRKLLGCHRILEDVKFQAAKEIAGTPDKREVSYVGLIISNHAMMEKN